MLLWHCDSIRTAPPNVPDLLLWFLAAASFKFLPQGISGKERPEVAAVLVPSWKAVSLLASTPMGSVVERYQKRRASVALCLEQMNTAALGQGLFSR